MSYWFAFRVFDRSIDINPGSAILEGPFETYESAKERKIAIRGGCMQKTSIFTAPFEDEAKQNLEKETWIV
jgi:hypothetical protein